MITEIKKGIEEFEMLAHAYQDIYQPKNTEEWGDGFWRCMKYSKDCFNSYTISILEAQIKEWEEKIKQYRIILKPLRLDQVEREYQIQGSLIVLENLIEKNKETIKELKR